jgi:hypothetical protein
VHVLGEHHDRIHIRLQQRIAELVFVEPFPDAADVVGVVKIEMNLAPGTAGEGGDLRVDPEPGSGELSGRRAGQERAGGQRGDKVPAKLGATLAE